MTLTVTAPRGLKRAAFSVALGYVAVAGLYIWLSDRVLARLAGSDVAQLSWLQTVKGLGFVLATGLVLFAVLRRLGQATWRVAQAEASRHLQEAHNQALFEHGPDAAMVLQGGRFSAVNQAACRLFRTGAGALVGTTPWAFSPERQPDGRRSEEAARATLAAIRPGEVLRFPWRHTRASGDEFDCEVSLTAMPGDADTVLAWVRDVTAEREAQVALADATERLRLLVEGNPHFFFYAQDLDGDITYVSPSVSAITGRSPDDWLGQRHWFTTESAGNQRAREATARHLAGDFDREPVAVEIRHADGRPVILEVYEYGRYVDGRLVGLHGVAHDVTGRRRAEQVQRALYQISHATAAASSLEELYPAIHAIVGELMPATNFYIALHDTEAQLVSFPYFVDEEDTPPAPRRARRGLTEYVIRTGRPVFVEPEDEARLAGAGEIETIGAPPADWLGVPLKVGERTLGVLAVQSYADVARHQPEDLDILSFVSSQVAMAIERKRAEQALRDSEQRLRDIVEHSTNLFYAHTPDHVLTYVSPQVRQFLDCGPEEALVRWTEFVTDNPANREGLERTERAIASGEPQPIYELELVGRKGRKIWVEVSEAPVVRDGRTVAIVGALRDVTEIRRANEALRESESNYRQLFERASDAILIFAPDNEEILAANLKACEIYGIPHDELIGMSLKQLSRDVGPGEERVRELLAGGSLLNFETVHLRRDGLPIFIQVSASVVEYGGRRAILSLNRDVSELREAQEALRESEERFRALVELSPDGIAVHAGGKLVFANGRGAQILGYSSPGEVIGRPVAEFVHPSSRAVVAERARRCLEERRPQPLLEEVFLRADGSGVEVEVASTPFTFRGLPAVQVVFRDISERRRVEEHLRQGQKLEAIGQLAGGVAHDFNNLLQAMLGTTQVLREGRSDPTRFTALTEELEANIRRGASLTRQLLLFSRREVTRPQRVDLGRVVADASELLRRLVPANIRLVTAIAPGPLPVDADRGQLEQVLVNLVVNAADAMPKGGELAITMGCDGDAWHWFEVRDTGHGISPEVKVRIFEPFFTTKGIGQGTGLGLSVVHGIVARHGGRVDVESREGKGTAFRVVLPASRAADLAYRDERTSPVIPAPGRGERILVVEDEEGVRAGLCEMLGLLGYRAEGVESAEAAESRLPDLQPDLVLTDHMLPGISGAALADRLRSRRAGTRVIVMSGYTADEVVRQDVLVGGIRFLQKPFDMTTLAAEVAAALTEEPAL